MADAALARRAIKLLDLTDLSDDASEAGLEQLCQRALMPPGPVAAICIWPRFVARARDRLAGTPVKIATVVNFPSGEEEAGVVLSQITQAIRDGADEIDLVLPWRAFLAGDRDGARLMVEAARTACSDRTLKVILETGGYPDISQVREAAELAIAAGADFIKTSTGKTARSATPEAARSMLEAIAASGRKAGLKPSGGIRSLQDAALYLALADAIMGANWAGPDRFRFGASGLHQVLLDAARGGDGGEADGSY